MEARELAAGQEVEQQIRGCVPEHPLERRRVSV